MAGDWIKLEIATLDKPEVYQIADELERDPDAVLGKLLRVWAWADQQTYDGHAPSVTLSCLDRVTNVKGFGIAMENVGWLVRKDGELSFPHFERHNGQTAKQRGLASRRKAKQRVTEMSRSKRDKNVTRVSLSSLTLTLKDLNKNDVSARMEKSWNEWIQYRAEIKKPLTKRTAEKLAQKLATWGDDRAVAAIDHTIANGWQGLREPDPPTNGKATKQPLGYTGIPEDD